MSLDLSRIVLLYNTKFMNQLKFNDFLKTNNKQQKVMDCTNFLQYTKSPLFPLRGMVVKLCKRKRVPCWSIYIISLW